MSSNEAGYTSAQRRELLAVARASIEAGLRGERLAVKTADYPPALREPHATFVTLHVGTALRGCVGSLETRRPLVEDVAHNARAAAFEDTRFAPLTPVEFGRLQIHISVLGAPESLPSGSEADVLRQLRPGVDGLILEEGMHRGTFLPAVWDELPAPRDFLRQLKRKAGLPVEYWSRTIRVRRYTVESIA